MSCVHRILTRETYTGVHHYNCTDSRLNRQRPKEEWVAISVPPIIEADVFARVKALLHQRRPTETPTRITNSEVLLTGIVHCESCGRPLMIRTGKSGRYRYYACSEYRLKGLTACGKPMANVSPTDLIGATWLDRSLDPNNVNYDAFAATSSDGGATFGTNYRLSTVVELVQRRLRQRLHGRLHLLLQRTELRGWHGPAAFLHVSKAQHH